jgi:hypothetical protein
MTVARSPGTTLEVRSTGTQPLAWGKALPYLSLSCVTGFVELGAVVYAIRSDFPLVGILGVALAYQVGALCKNPLELSPYLYRILVGTSLISGIGLLWFPELLIPSVLLLSAGLQGLREGSLRGSAVSTFWKRSSRILGFLAAALFQPNVFVGVALLVLVLGSLFGESARARPRAIGLVPNRGLGAVGIIMVLHQLHYFTYAYCLPVLFIQLHFLTGPSIGLAFAAGWVSYTLAPLFLARLPTLPVVLAGHVGVSVVLASMAIGADHLTWLLVAWFASGFGGGTVFCIRRLAQVWAGVDSTGDLDLWENVGHVSGVLVAFLVALSGLGLAALFWSAAGFALTTAGSITALGLVRQGLADSERS